MLGNFKDIINRLEAQKSTIEKALATLREFDEGGAPIVGAAKKATAKKGKKKRVLSEAGRKAIGDAARKRWAGIKRAAKKVA